MHQPRLRRNEQSCSGAKAHTEVYIFPFTCSAKILVKAEAFDRSHTAAHEPTTESGDLYGFAVRKISRVPIDRLAVIVERPTGKSPAPIPENSRGRVIVRNNSGNAGRFRIGFVDLMNFLHKVI